MSEGLNMVQLIGNLGKDPELRYTQSGTPVLNFRMATTESYAPKDGGERQEKTEWHGVVLWGKRAEALNKFLVKGARIYIAGRLTTRSWEKDGDTRYTTEVTATKVLLLGGKRKEGAPDGAPPPGDGDGGDDIPF
jgi:single-strand DNA-binding protein